MAAPSKSRRPRAPAPKVARPKVASPKVHTAKADGVTADAARDGSPSSPPAADATEPTNGAGSEPRRLRDPDGGQGDIHELLTAAVEEAARLLHADGAMVYLADPTTGRLRYAHDAGIKSRRSRRWVREIELEPGTGMFGHAVATRTVAVTRDYPNDRSFRHAQDPDRVVADIGIVSMVVAPMAAGGEVFGALGTFSGRPDAFDDAQIALVRSLADHAAASMANARLVEELGRSRAALARRADAEQALREIGARITALRDPAEILQEVVKLASRLVGGQGAILDLLQPGTTNLHWAYDDGLGALFSEAERAELWISVGVGATGSAVAEDRTVIAGDDLASLFPPSPESTEFYRRTGFRSMIVAPITGEDGPLGVIEVYATGPDAFDESDGALIRGLASQAAIAITNARLITELASSRAALTRTADAERTLREIAAHVSALHDQDEILQAVVDAATRLLRASGAMIDLVGLPMMAGAWTQADDSRIRSSRAFVEEIEVDPEAGLSGLAISSRHVESTGNYLADERFAHTPERDDFARHVGIRSVVAAPLLQGDDVLGVITVYVDREDGFDEADEALLAGLADQAAVAIANVHLIRELERSREENARRADAEQALREIGARITAIREPGDLLQRIVDESLRLLRADGAMIDQYDPESGTLQWAFDAGIPEGQREAVKMTDLKPGEGVSGKAVAEGRVIIAGDYPGGEFRHDELADSLAAGAGIRDLIVAPIIGDAGPLGAIEVFSRKPHAFGELDATVLGGLAEQAAIAMTNARLIGELERSQAALARRAETERSLRDITARIAALRDRDEILARVVEEAKRLLATDGAHLTRLHEGGTHLVPLVVAGATSDENRDWLLSLHFPLSGGINGLAAETGTAIWTFDYEVDPRIPHDSDDVDVARRLELRGMAAAPLRAPGGEVIGTLAVSTAEPRAFEADELDLLQGLADQAAIALTNSTLLDRLRSSEERYRYLVQNAPDLVWSIDADARFTFLSDAVERLSGFTPDELLGRHFGALIHESSREVAEFDWTEALRGPSQEARGRFTLQHRDGSGVPAEFIAVASLDADGRFLSANGSVRDMREQDRLERELRESQSRYKTLASSSPDLVFATDADGRYTFLSDRATMLGWDLATSLGRHFMEFVAPGWEGAALASYEEVIAEPTLVHTARIDFLRGNGQPVPLEINIIGSFEGDRLTAIHGVARDVSERERLQDELQRSEERYRFLVEQSPDIVFTTDAEGRFTFLSNAIERMTGYAPGELVGEHFSVIVDPPSMPLAAERWERAVAEPDVEVQADLMLTGKDGHRTPVDVRAVGVTVEGRFAGIQGATRDVSDQVSLETELRRQAGELAAGEERAHLARELHDSVTQALFSMTLVSRSVELLLERDADAAREQLGQLRELQREALAEMRALIFELRPGNIEQDGLVRALRTHTAALQGRIGLPVVVESDLDDRLPLEVEEGLYRIAQEALHNVVKHASARQVWLDLRRVGRDVRLRIEDDGKGFDPSAVPDGHLGLAGMRARSDRMGASLAVDSGPGAGTRIEVLVPFAALRAPAASRATVPAGAPTRDG